MNCWEISFFLFLSIVLFSGVTILLSLTVFMNMVQNIMPNTSDAVPLIGQSVWCVFDPWVFLTVPICWNRLEPSVILHLYDNVFFRLKTVAVSYDHVTVVYWFEYKLSLRHISLIEALIKKTPKDFHCSFIFIWKMNEACKEQSFVILLHKPQERTPQKKYSYLLNVFVEKIKI